MAMTLSAIMNLTGNFQAQMQANAQAMSGMAQQAVQAGNAVKNSLSENIGQKLSSGLAVARDALGAAGVASAGFLKSCVDGAANAEKVNADLAQTIKSTGGAAGLTAEQVADMATSLSQASTFSKGTIEAGQNMLLTFTNIGSNVFPQASQALTNLATKMKSDPSSAAIQLGKALNDPTSGLTALTRVGITFSDQQKEQIKTMQAAGDMAGAQTVILGELNKEFGGQAQAAAQTYDGQMKQLANTFASVKGTIGSAVLPYLLQIAQKLNEGAKEVANFVKEHKNLVAVILSVTAVFGTLIGGASLFQHVLSFLGPTVQSIAGLIGGLSLPMIAVIAVIGALVYAYTQNFGGMKDFIDSIISSIVSFVKQHMPEIKATIQSVFEGIQVVWNSVLKPVLTFIMSTLGQVVNWVKANWPLILQTVNTVMNNISNVINEVLSAIESFWNTWGQTIMDYVSMCFNNVKIVITTAITVIEDVLKAIMQAINGDWSGAWQSVCDAVGSIFGGAIDIIQNVINGIGNIFSDIATIAYNWGKDMIDGIVNGIKGAIGDVENAVSGVADKIKSFLHFSVPDEGPLTDYETWMPDFMKGLSNGIKVNTHLVTEPIKDLSVGIKTNTLGGLQNNAISTQGTSSKGASGSKIIQIAKLADSIIVREESDIDKIATAIANKLIQTELGMA